ncbi:MAG: hypothetical protein H5T73_07810 [Actinobacteria bacterium]|nr:hypothetical protein [Actinomycetota bacterium]
MDGEDKTARREAMEAVAGKIAADLAALREDIASCSLCRGGGRGLPGAGRLGARLYLLAGRPGPGASPRNPWGGWWDALGGEMRRRWGWKEEDIYLATALRCPLGRVTGRDIRLCAPYLAEELMLLGPRVVLACGKAAAVALREALGQAMPEQPHAGDVCSLYATSFVFQFDVSRLEKERDLWDPFWRIVERCDGMLRGRG